MKLNAELIIETRDSYLADFFRQAHKREISVTGLRLVGEAESGNRYACDVFFGRKDDFDLFLGALEVLDSIRVVKVIHRTEELARGGMIRVSAKLDARSADELDSFIYSSRELILGHVGKGSGFDYSSVSRNVLFVTMVFEKESGTQRQADYFRQYLDNEADALLFSYVSGMTGIPLVIQAVTADDYRKFFHGLALNFSAIRVNVINGGNVDLLRELRKDLAVPLISHELDEVPLAVLACVMRMIRDYIIDRSELTVGITGLDQGLVRLTRLMKAIGIKRVLGFDDDEEKLLEFESAGGMATIKENVFGNADVMILGESYLHAGHEGNFTTGQIVISCGSPWRPDPVTAGTETISVRASVSAGSELLKSVTHGLLLSVLMGESGDLDESELIKGADKIASELDGECRLEGKLDEAIARVKGCLNR